MKTKKKVLKEWVETFLYSIDFISIIWVATTIGTIDTPKANLTLYAIITISLIVISIVSTYILSKYAREEN